ncbi:hypothetical protein SCAR479_12814 [Seiridium cardinale]|uniref:Methyltransferase domain-containing protein n=1 Tax=Seiridium cardinale TaxID=138064 RepID=A0ABR2X9S2_9PEZI
MAIITRAQAPSTDPPKPKADVLPEGNDFTRGNVTPSRSVEWYQPTFKNLSDTARQVFVEYSGIPEDQIAAHVYRVRDKAWDILPYPCIGVFRFLDFGANMNPIYPEVLRRVRGGDILLDLGCCFGQDIRKFAADGAPSKNMLGVDSEDRYIELGYELFKDRGTLQSKFYTQSVFDEDFLPEWCGRVDIIYVGSFLHLFNFEKQQEILAQLVRVLRKRPGAMVFGRHLGAEQGGEFHMRSLGWDVYRHSEETMRKLWADVPEGQWNVSAEITRYESKGWDNDRRGWQGDDTQQMTFVATRRL